MGVIATDNFNRADQNDPLGGNWTAQKNFGVGITSNKASNKRTSEHLGERRTGEVWPNDQYSQAKFVTIPDRHMSVRVRCKQAVEDTFYAGGFDVDVGGNKNRRIWKNTNGSRLSLASEAINIAANDLVYLEIQGTTLKLFINGVERLSVIDGSFASGDTGLGCRDEVGADNAQWDNWEGGDFAAGETPVSQIAESDYEGLGGLCPSEQKAFESLISVRREL